MRRADSHGFTMIELLMVIMIIAALGAVAVPQFLDFRNEGKAAALRTNLHALRAGIKLQQQQMKLRCNYTSSESATAYGNRIIWNMMYNDSTTFDGSHPPQALDNTALMCTQAQVTNATERKFMDLSGSTLANWAVWSGGTSIEGNTSGTFPYLMPANPFTPLEATASVRVDITSSITLSTLNTAYGGSICNYVNARLAVGRAYHWIVIQDTPEIYPGTNTSGINECNF